MAYKRSVMHNCIKGFNLFVLYPLRYRYTTEYLRIKLFDDSTSDPFRIDMSVVKKSGSKVFRRIQIGVDIFSLSYDGEWFMTVM